MHTTPATPASWLALASTLDWAVCRFKFIMGFNHNSLAKSDKGEILALSL